MATNKNKLKKGLYRKSSQSSRMRRVSKFYSKLEPCSAKYALSLADPTNEKSRGACIPQGFPMPSQKVRAFIRGTCSTLQAGGLGFLAFYPVIANDTPVVRYTTGGLAAGVSQNSNFNGGGFLAASTTTNMTKLPYTTAQLAADQVEGRFISGCIRVRYNGSENNRQGQITMLEAPDHEDLYVQTFSTIKQYEASTTTRPGGEGEWSQINWSGPAKSSEINYAVTPSVTGTNVPIIILMEHVNGGGVGATYEQTYDFEAWVNVEYVGRVTVGKTNVEIDPLGFAKIQQTVKAIAATQPIDPSATTRILEGANRLLNSNVGRSFMNTAQRAITGLLGPKGNTNAYNPYVGSQKMYRSSAGMI